MLFEMCLLTVAIVVPRFLAPGAAQQFLFVSRWFSTGVAGAIRLRHGQIWQQYIKNKT
jgi:hypothetical protein